MGPHRGPTSHYRGYAAGTPADSAMLPHVKAPHDVGMKCDPYGVGSRAACTLSAARVGRKAHPHAHYPAARWALKGPGYQ